MSRNDFAALKVGDILAARSGVKYRVLRCEPGEAGIAITRAFEGPGPARNVRPRDCGRYRRIATLCGVTLVEFPVNGRCYSTPASRSASPQ